MAALLALLIALAIVLAWRFSAGKRTTNVSGRPRFLGPDDDPDFLRELDRRSRPRDDDA